MKKKKLKVKLLQAEEDRVKALQTKSKVLKEVRVAYNTLKELHHHDEIQYSEPNASAKYCSRCRIVVKTLRDLLAPYQMDFIMEDHYLPALKVQIEKANHLFFPEHEKQTVTFNIEPYNWRFGEQKKSNPDNSDV